MESFPQYIAGSWREGAGWRRIESPYDGRPVGQAAVSVAADAEEALAGAAAAFETTRRLPAHVRHRILRQIETELSQRREEFARGIAEEAGKPIRDARGEVERACLVFSLAAEEARRIGGEILPLDLNAASEGRVGFVRRYPVGPVAALTPFNFPLNLVAHKVAPAIACGCPVLLKPAEKTPLTALRLAQIIAKTPWPREAFSVLTPAEPAAVGAMLTRDPRAPVFSFTGSARVGWHLQSLAGRKRVTLELGGNAGAIIEPDADLEVAVRRCALGAFANAGQVCISVQRLFVHRRLFAPFTERLVAQAAALRVGDPLDEATEVGPMISAAAADGVENKVADALAEGACALLRGERRAPTVLTPTVLTRTNSQMAVACEEIFGPVVAVEEYEEFEDALARLDEGPYGLQAGLFTRDVGRIFTAFDRLQVGAVIANDVPQYRVDNMPYGGEKESGHGREGVRYALEAMTTPRLLALRLP